MEINSYSIQEGYLKLLREVYENGSVVLDERNSETIELLNMCVVIKNPLNDFYKLQCMNNNLDFDKYVEKYLIIPNLVGFNGSQLVTYCEQLFNPNKGSFTYTYGERLLGYQINSERLDQLEYVKEKLKENRNSRRALIITWMPTCDCFVSEVPCLQLIDFKIRNDKLNVSALWRSHDVKDAWFPNIVGILSLSNHIAEYLNIHVGDVSIYSLSAHIYKKTIPKKGLEI